MGYNLVFVITAVMLLLTAPALATYTDKCGNRKLLLNMATIGTIVAYLVAGYSAIYNMPVAVAFLSLIAGQYFFQMSYVFFDPLLNDLSGIRYRARASGMAQFCSATGMIFGLVISLPLIEMGGRLAPLIPSVLLMLILTLPLMIFYKEKTTKLSPAKKHKIKLGFDWKKFRQFLFTSAAAPILIAFFFYTNALNTITNNYSIYAGKVLDMADGMTSIILIVVQIAAAIGALLIGFLGDRLGIRRCLIGVLWIWLSLIPTIAAANNMNLFFALAAVLGLTIGAGWSISRAYISTNLEKGQIGYGFSFYTIFERFSSMVGPLAWGGVLALGGGYRTAMLSMAVFIAIGIIILARTNPQSKK